MLKTLVDTLRAYWLLGEVVVRTGFSRPTKTDRRSLVIFAPQFVPCTDVGVFRVLELARYALNDGWRVTIFTDSRDYPSTPASRYLERRVPDGINVIRVPTPGLRPGWNWFPRIDGGFLAGLAHAKAFQYRASVLAPSAIISTGPEFHGFVAGMYAAKSSGAPLVLDYRDEWTLNPRMVTDLGNSDEYWERQCLKAAAGVIYLNDTVRDIYVDRFHQLNEKPVEVINNGWDEYEFSMCARSGEFGDRSEDSDGFVIDFIGYVANHQRPDHFLATLEQVVLKAPALANEISVVITGQVQPHLQPLFAQFEQTCPDLVSLSGQVDRAAAVELTCRSDCLLVINNFEMSTTLPVKLIEYMAAMRPILVFGGGGPIERIVRETASGLVVEDQTDTDRLIECIEQIRSSPDSRWVTPSRKQWVEEHRRSRLSRRFLDFVASAQ